MFETPVLQVSCCKHTFCIFDSCNLLSEFHLTQIGHFKRIQQKHTSSKSLCAKCKGGNPIKKVLSQKDEVGHKFLTSPQFRFKQPNRNGSKISFGV